ncbi:hypothetical protein SAMN02745172_02855 [Pseudoxanthobacter soli DSM 19599]|uniref:Uncharacterized protein n=1 Tax=Pseudoxanthobacter soli DSM 19599 TaxID=1123029 RepID=A0A1M7ZMS6_9HYPH|nr:hypothetical protein [Pseudoxanthobacter soli]SHO66200.1 hypothetical protein SAMN02745172_02855 [Pseudoxanthobacter soli DSM 19599]
MPVRKLWSRQVLAAAAAAVLAAGCQDGTAALNAAKSARIETLKDQFSCGEPDKLWIGRFTAKGGRGMHGGDEIACFKRQSDCEAWLAVASDGSGEIVERSCRPIAPPASPAPAA